VIAGGPSRSVKGRLKGRAIREEGGKRYLVDHRRVSPKRGTMTCGWRQWARGRENQTALEGEEQRTASDSGDRASGRATRWATTLASRQ
jgi:hypothetical protein